MKITPIRKQYLNIKNRYPGIIIFFRIGDFYETFDDDAKIVSRELEITLTSKELGKGLRVPLAGIPYHAVDNYLLKLINKGYKVAICEQLTQPGKGLVERDVIRIVTPGTLVEPSFLKDKSNNFLASLIVEDENAGFSYIDITTGEFATTQTNTDKLFDEVERIQPAEILISEKNSAINLVTTATVTKLNADYFLYENAYEVLKRHFGVANLEGFGCAHLPLAIKSAGSIISYISDTQKLALNQIKRLSTYTTQSFMMIDFQTRRNLEIFTSSRWGTLSKSLLSILDMTKTSMGGRLLRKWLGQPLLDIKSLNYRQDCISYFVENNINRTKVMLILSEIGDIERIINRIKSNLASPHDLIILSTSLKKLPALYSLIEQFENYKHYIILRNFEEITTLIDKAIVDDPNLSLELGRIIRKGFSEELDSIRELCSQSKQYIARLEQKEKARTGIKSLKVLYNRVFGYFIEISKANLNLVPTDYIRKQTLANCERFYTPELKEYEQTILSAQEKIESLELDIFRQVCMQIAEYIEEILKAANYVAEIDVYAALADVAVKNKYTRPELNMHSSIIIKNGRHPVVEKYLTSETFIPNDTFLNNDDTQIVILTGPNMSGKSTYLKQVALIVLMAQIGSYVPADEAKIGIVDRIFTRIGAQEDLAAGQSTFMVEMIETANILNNATPKSLIILDEVGRGTSTYDGLSIAWAIVEYIHNNPSIRSKTLFATHYHELVALANILPRVKNYNVLVNDEDGKVVFLRKIAPGSTDKSYGIHVAKLAGVPSQVVNRAEEVLLSLENNFKQTKSPNLIKCEDYKVKQLTLFNASDVLDDIFKLDIDSMSPLEAITTLYQLKQRVKAIKEL